MKKAVEPVHVQMNLPDYGLTMVNSTREPRDGFKLATRVLTLDSVRCWQRADDAVECQGERHHDLPRDLGIAERVSKQEGMVLVTLAAARSRRAA